MNRGWPSFTKPIEPANIKELPDTTLGMARTGVRSKPGDSHLGHVFTAGKYWEQILANFPQGSCGDEDPVNCFSAEKFIKRVFMDSDTGALVRARIARKKPTFAPGGKPGSSSG